MLIQAFRTAMLFLCWVTIWHGKAPAQEAAGSRDPQPESAAEEVANTASPITLEQAVSMAVDNDPEYQQINWAIEQAKGDRRQATRLPNPTAGVTGEEIGNAGSGGQYGVFWSQNVVRSNRLQVQKTFYSAEIQKLQQQYEIRRWQIAGKVAQSYLKIVRRQQELQVTNDHLERVDEIFEISQKLFEVGEVSKVEVATIKVEIAGLRQQLIEKKQEINSLCAALAVRMGLTQRVLSQHLDSPVFDCSFDWRSKVDRLLNHNGVTVDDSWINQHPQLRLIQWQIRQAQSQIALARAQRCPDVQVQGNLAYGALTEDVFAGFQVGIPLQRNDRKTGLISAAQANYQRTVEVSRQKKMQLQQQVLLISGQISQLRSRAINIRDEIIPQVDQNLSDVRQTFQAGEAPFLQLKLALDLSLLQRIRLVDAEYQLALTQVQLESLIINDEQ